MRLFRIVLALAAVVCVAASAAGASLTMQIGAAEDEGRNSDPAVARAKVDLAKAAGFDVLRVTAIWAPGQRAVPADQLEALRAVAAAGAFDGITIYTTVMPFGSRTTPLTDTARAQFAAFAADMVRRVPGLRNVIVGNEPNINRYWLPQFGPNGEDVAAQQYEQLLARTYDAVKKASAKAFVIGGSLSPHGSDDPKLSRPTHSPTGFINDLGVFYRASGRKKPIMDGFALHPYGENSSVPPTAVHPNSTTIGLADYDKLVRLLGAAFDGTAQKGSKLPIVYDEYGIESVPPPAELTLYHGREPTTTKPVAETTQGEYYDEALQLAACEPTVRAMFLFHVTDETDRDRWQSGVYYPNGKPKSTRAVVKETIDQVHAHAVDCTAVNVPSNDGWILITGATTAGQTAGATSGKPAQRDPRDAWRLISTGP
ncbi:MAG: hypothetical protein ACJ747_08410 [Gaiellaceae bacterium]|jgi:hypothetical protein